MNRVQRKLFGIALLIGGLALIAGGAYHVLLSGNSRVAARIKVLREVAAAPESRPAGFAIESDFIRKEMEVVRSDLVLSNVVVALNLAQTWSASPDGKPLAAAEAVTRLRQKLELFPVNGTALVDIGVAGEAPDAAAAIANAVADAVQAYERERREKLVAESVGNSVGSLEEQWLKLGEQIREAREQLRQLQPPPTMALEEPAVASNAPPDFQTITELRQKIELLEQARSDLKDEFIAGKHPGPPVTCANVEIVSRAAAPLPRAPEQSLWDAGLTIGGALLCVGGWLMLNRPAPVAAPGRTR